MRERYPPIEPLVTHSIPVDEPHVLHVEECGRLKGIPVVFLHGGPGAGCTPSIAVISILSDIESS